MREQRLDHLKSFYALLDKLIEGQGGLRALGNCTGRMLWPERGVYFFFEDGETRLHSGSGLRVVRVGTHALKTGSSTSLWKRLSQHRGTLNTGGGNHRGSVFRLHVGSALLRSNPEIECASWSIGQSAPAEVRFGERHIESLVSQVIGRMPFTCIVIGDDAGPQSKRGYLERNAIALLSNYQKASLDPASQSWLGLTCASERVQNSGLWNSNHVDEHYDPAFLDELKRAITTRQA